MHWQCKQEHPQGLGFRTERRKKPYLIQFEHMTAYKLASATAAILLKHSNEICIHKL